MSAVGDSTTFDPGQAEREKVKRDELRRMRSLRIQAKVGDHVVADALVTLNGHSVEQLQKILTLACWPNGVRIHTREVASQGF